MLAKKIGGASKLFGHKEAPQPTKPKVEPETPPEESTPEEPPPAEEPAPQEKAEAEEPPAEPAEAQTEIPAEAPEEAATAPSEDATGGENIEPGPDDSLESTTSEESIETEEPAAPEKEDDINYLLFSNLNPEEFQRIYAKLRSVKIPHGLRICRDGDDGDSIFIVAQGEAEVTKKNEKGEERLLAKLTPGMFFGEMAYFLDGKRHATVEAVTDVQLLELSKKDMDEVTAEFPSVKEVMLSFYKERVLENLLVLSPLTAILSSEDRQKLISKFELQEFAVEQPIVKEGDPGDAMFLIKSGKAEVSTIDPKEKKKLVLASFGPGDFFGEVSLIKNKPRTATIMALTPMEVLVINRKSFNELTREHPEMVFLLEQTIEKRVEDTIKKIIGEPK